MGLAERIRAVRLEMGAAAGKQTRSLLVFETSVRPKDTRIVEAVEAMVAAAEVLIRT